MAFLKRAVSEENGEEDTGAGSVCGLILFFLYGSLTPVISSCAGISASMNLNTIDVIRDSVDIIDIMKPVYNFKASDDELPWKKKK